MNSNEMPPAGIQCQMMAKLILHTLMQNQQQQPQQNQSHSTMLSVFLSSLPNALSSAYPSQNRSHAALSQSSAILVDVLSKANTQSSMNHRSVIPASTPASGLPAADSSGLLKKVNDIKTMLTLLTQSNPSNQLSPEHRALVSSLLQNALAELGLLPISASSPAAAAAAAPSATAAPASLTIQDTSNLTLNMLGQQASRKPCQSPAAGWMPSNSSASQSYIQQQQQWTQIPALNSAALSSLSGNNFAELLKQDLATVRALVAMESLSSKPAAKQASTFEDAPQKKPNFITRESVGPFPQKLFQILEFLKDDCREGEY